MEQAREYPIYGEIALLSLAKYAFAEDESYWDEANMILADWDRSPGTMQKAIWVLEEDEVTPEELLSENLKDAAQLVFRHLVE
jgi:hypothetical protein